MEREAEHDASVFLRGFGDYERYSLKLTESPTAGLGHLGLRASSNELYAIRDECSHDNVALSDGEVDGTTIECWLHGSIFDLHNGKPLCLPANKPVPVYAVRIEGADVLVDLSARPHQFPSIPAAQESNPR